jgi:phosphoadenosine phosphosulfate reductase
VTISLSRLENFYGDFDAQSLLRVMIEEEFRSKIALLTSFGADAAIMLSLVAEVNPATPVLFLETCKHFSETLGYAKTLTAQLKLTNVHYLKPDDAMRRRIDPNENLWQENPSRCCWLRKVEPLDRAIEHMGLEAIITGRKRYQTPERAELNTIELDDKGIFRINPIAHWSKTQSLEETTKRNLPVHPLTVQGYRSIGCKPCTLPVAEGQDERAGRWAHTIGIENEQKTECGIHLPAAQTDWSL